MITGMFLQAHIEQVVALGPLIARLGIMLAAALMVERFLVLIGWIIDQMLIFETINDKNSFDPKQKNFEKAKNESDLIENEKPGTDDPREIEFHPDNNGSESVFDIKELKPPELITDPKSRLEMLTKRGNVKKELWMQIFGTLVATLGCILTRFSIWSVIDSNGNFNAENDTFFGFIFTGVIIGAGSKPINFLMNFLLNRKIEVVKEEAEDESVREQVAVAKNLVSSIVPVSKEAPKLIKLSIEEIVGFKYDGGDRPERLEQTHLYKQKIDTIVYHHTAMHSDSPFQEVINEFDRKGWLTGYHCIVFKDGSVRVLCRWDRFGNHAKGYNTRSMGIALMGNFETDPKVPFSNHDGSFGIIKPTAIQVETAARMVALIALMHDIPVKFAKKGDATIKGIVPHNVIAAKACPGNNFPYSNFEEKVKSYAELWKENHDFKLALEDFRKFDKVIPIIA